MARRAVTVRITVDTSAFQAELGRIIGIGAVDRDRIYETMMMASPGSRDQHAFDDKPDGCWADDRYGDPCNDKAAGPHGLCATHHLIYTR